MVQNQKTRQETAGFFRPALNLGGVSLIYVLRTVIGRITKGGINHHQTLRVVANIQLVSNSHTAVHLGCMGTLNAKTLEYTKTREQFGVAIGSFQSLQHRMVDTMMAYEQAKSLLFKVVCEYKQDPASAAASIHAL